MDRADISLEDWVQETCYFSAVTSDPGEPITFKEAWDHPIQEEREQWWQAIRSELQSMAQKRFGPQYPDIKYPITEDSLETSGFSK